MVFCDVVIWLVDSLFSLLYKQTNYLYYLFKKDVLIYQILII